MTPKPAAIGFRVKTGWATAVLLVGTSSKATVIDRRKVQLADPAEPDSYQPYHAALDLPAKEGAKVIARLVKVVEHYAGRAVVELIEEHRKSGHRITSIGIVVGSDVDPKSIKNDHIRAHAAEGQLYRLVIEKAARECGVAITLTVEKQLYAKASRVLQRPEALLKKEVTALGRGLGGGWRAEDKAATLAAWIALPAET